MFKIWLETNEIVMPKLFEKLKQSSAYSGVHFSRSDQLSYNINPTHHDPIGIYVFPKKYVLEGSLNKNQGFAQFPYAFVIEPTSNAKFLNLDMDENTAKRLIKSIGVDETLFDDPQIYHKSRQKTPGHIFWGVLEHIRNSRGLSKNASWNTIFSRMGFNAIYDPGLAVIHYNEPSQIVYLDHKAYKVIDVLKNTNDFSLQKQFASYFPEYRMYKKFGGFGGGKDEFHLTLKKDDIEIYTYVSKYNPNRIDVKVYGHGGRLRSSASQEWRREISSKNDLDDLVEDIKHYMQNHDDAYLYEPRPTTPESYENIIKKIAKIYNLKLDKKNPNELSKSYRDDTKFRLLYNWDKNELQITIQGNPSSLSHRSYFYYSEPVVALEDNIEKAVQEVLNSLENYIKSIKNDDNWLATTERYFASDGLKFVKFLRDKVFVKRKST